MQAWGVLKPNHGQSNDKCYPGYVYKEVLSPDNADTGPLGPHLPPALSVHVTGSWAFTTTQTGSEVVGVSLGGHKCSAAAPGTLHHSHVPKHLASAADFSPTHFDEPNSNLLALQLLATVASSRHLSPVLSTFLVNHLLQWAAPVIPSLHSESYVSHMAWLRREGLAPIPEGYAVPSYMQAVLEGLPTSAVLGGVASTLLG